MRTRIWLFYKLGLRRALNSSQRFLLERDAPQADLPTFDTPTALVDYLQEAFEYRKDRGPIIPWWDWSSAPRVIQARLNSDAPDGDCDDLHQYAATQLRTMESVSKVYVVNATYWATPEKKNKRGHSFCIFRWQGEWRLLNYTLSRLAHPEKAPLWVARRMTRSSQAVVDWATFEGPNFKLAAIYPKVPEL